MIIYPRQLQLYYLLSNEQVVYMMVRLHLFQKLKSFHSKSIRKGYSIRKLFLTAMASCSRFIWIKNFSDHNKV